MKVKRWLIVFGVIMISGIAALGITFFMLTNPSVKIAGWQELDLNKLSGIYRTATVVDGDNNVIAENIYSKNRIYTPLSDIPRHTLDAFTSIEDKRFYSHHGVDYLRMLGAAKNNIFSASLKEGASTITQQLIKNTHLSNKKTFSRKLQEIRIAKQLEKEYTKQQILEAYLNIVYFGNNVYGIGQAARTYFGKDVSKLDMAESALLAGIINNPSKFNPLSHKDLAVKRRNVVLKRMVENHKADPSVAAKEKLKAPEIIKYKPDPYSLYIGNVIAEAARKLDCLQEELFEKKPTIVASANMQIFDDIYNSMSDIVSECAHNMHILVVDNRSMDVLCDIGNISDGGILRQPGSAIKPFVSYAPALEKKLVFPVSIINDEKTDFNGYSPKNFGNKYNGHVTVKESLSQSLNIPAVKLTDMCGLQYSKSVASRFGIRFSDKDNGLALALGGFHDGITLNSLTDAYAALANSGEYRKSAYVDAVYSAGKLLYKRKDDGYTAVGSDTAFLMTDMLMQCAKDGTAKKLAGFDNVAAKTGTVERGEKNSDAYCIAYTPRYTVSVWYGNDVGADIYGGKQPADTAKRVLGILDDKNVFAIPDSVVKADIDVRKLDSEKTVYLASPTLEKRYRSSVYFSKNNMPVKYSYGDMPFIFDDEFESNDFDDFEIVDGFFQ